ncbi:esterase/lipase family protein [Hydrogenophaga sp.]|uniref:esterase/lipase family protein n=1 Tax=Hydrogenophaga sp. TaxID=1904254 RepID=UPI003565DA94
MDADRPGTELPSSERPKGSRLARLQQCTTLGLLALGVAWVLGWWTRSPFWALAGVLLCWLGYAGVLGLELLAVWWVNRRDPTPRAGWTLLRQAWWQEVRAAPLVFAWRQPFRWRCLPDGPRPQVPGAPAAVFVHGFVCNRGFWLPWMRVLRERGQSYTSVNLEPVFGSIDDYVPLIEAAVQRAHALTGTPPVLICHSMGGLAARAWLARTPGAAARVRQVVTIGTPHYGTWLAQFSHLPNGRQMRIGGGWLRNLAAREAGQAHTPDYARFICWYSNADNIVFPASTATLPGADNRLLPGAAHVALAFQPRVMADTLALLSPTASAAS